MTQPPNIFIPPKNETPKLGLLIFAAITLIAIFAFANLYAILNTMIPLKIVQLALPWIYALAVSYCMSWGFYLGKIHGNNIIILGVIGSIVSLYSLWFIWEATLLGKPLFSTIGQVWTNATYIKAQNLSYLGKVFEESAFTSAVWTIESILILLIPIFTINDRPPKLPS